MQTVAAWLLTPTLNCACKELASPRTLRASGHLSNKHALTKDKLNMQTWQDSANIYDTQQLRRPRCAIVIRRRRFPLDAWPGRVLDQRCQHAKGEPRDGLWIHPPLRGGHSAPSLCLTARGRLASPSRNQPTPPSASSPPSAPVLSPPSRPSPRCSYVPLVLTRARPSFPRTSLYSSSATVHVVPYKPHDTQALYRSDALEVEMQVR